MNDPKKMIAQLLCNNGFKRRGLAFFRVYGDGIFQVVKYESERTVKGKMLRIGLNSMYSEMLPQWFTSSYCVTQYELAWLIGERFTADIGVFSGGFALQAYPLEKQLEILEQYGIQFLNSMETQQQLVEAMCQMDSCRGANIRWNDFTKFAPYLASNNFQMAEKVIDAILDQHASANESQKKLLSEEEYLEWNRGGDAEDAALYKLKIMAQQKNVDEIQHYLKSNYEINCQLARFCMK